jgi:hypothetical protein
MNHLTILKLLKSKQLTNINSSIYREKTIFLAKKIFQINTNSIYLNGFVSLYEVMNKQR